MVTGKTKADIQKKPRNETQQMSVGFYTYKICRPRYLVADYLENSCENIDSTFPHSILTSLLSHFVFNVLKRNE